MRLVVARYPTACRHYSTPRNTEPTAPSGLPLHRIFEPTFPLPFRDSVTQWLRRNDRQRAETAVLECVNLGPNSVGNPYKVNSLDVPVHLPPNSLRTNPVSLPLMNELEVTRADNVYAGLGDPTVLVHGYGAAKGFFYQNLRALADCAPLHALDWLGYGRSDRVSVRLPRFRQLKQGVLYAENYFVTALESWRAFRKIERFALVAHSLGAPIACAYARRYPSRVSKIAFVSPASVNRTPYAIDSCELYADDADPPVVAPITGRPLQIPRWFAWLWEQHCSPFSLVRFAGPLGPKLTSGWTSRRFRALPLADQRALQVYAYTMFTARGSGEYLLNYFLTAGSAGRWPMVERLRGLMCPSLWLYGDKDWMDVQGGVESVRRLREMGQQAELAVVPKSGHHLYLDNVAVFNEHLRTFLGSKGG